MAEITICCFVWNTVFIDAKWIEPDQYEFYIRKRNSWMKWNKKKWYLCNWDGSVIRCSLSPFIATSKNAYVTVTAFDSNRPIVVSVNVRIGRRAVYSKQSMLCRWILVNLSLIHEEWNLEIPFSFTKMYYSSHVFYENSPKLFSDNAKMTSVRKSYRPCSIRSLFVLSCVVVTSRQTMAPCFL